MSKVQSIFGEHPKPKKGVSLLGIIAALVLIGGGVAIAFWPFFSAWVTTH